MKIPYTKCKNAQEAYTEVQKNLTSDFLQKFNVNAQMQFDDQKKVITAKGSGFELNGHCQEDGVDLKLDLSLLLKPFKNKVLSYIEHQLKKFL